jgi:[protein-PII] uridylyltransferase
VTSPARWGATLGALAAVLKGEQTVDALLATRRTKARDAAVAAGRPKIAIDNQLSDAYTVIEVKSPDRLGLLYQITRSLSALGLDIASARIATEIDKALDTFYVADQRGNKLDDAACARTKAALEQNLRESI